MSRSLCAVLVALAVPALLADDGRQGPATANTTAAQASGLEARIKTGEAKVFDTSLLHHVTIQIAPHDADLLIRRTDDRERCRFTFDGSVLDDVGVRQAGGIYHAYVSISGKPSLSFKFDEFTKGQTLFGLDKLVLKNELQDYSLVNEHLAYEVFRRAGVPAPLTAYAQVSINGIDDGIYLVREPIDKDFLVRNFGTAGDSGNVYEIENMRDFVLDPSYPNLKDEGKNGHVRGDLVRFAKAIRGTNGKAFERDLSPYLDIDRFVTYIGAELATRHWDGLTYRNNNTYVYARPSDGKFVFLPYGADQDLGGPSMMSVPMTHPLSYLVQELFSSPTLTRRVRDEAVRIGREPVWNQQVLSDRLARVAEALKTAAPRSGRTGRDVDAFERSRSTMEQIVKNGGAVK